MGIFGIRYAAERDIPFWQTLDRHLPKAELLLKIAEKRCYVLMDGDQPIGVLRYNLFWDEIPFLTLIYLEDSHRQKGFGAKAMAHWEGEMRSLGYAMVMTSTMVEENAQHFYRKLGYKDCGCLVLDSQTMEMFMSKQL